MEQTMAFILIGAVCMIVVIVLLRFTNQPDSTIEAARKGYEEEKKANEIIRRGRERNEQIRKERERIKSEHEANMKKMKDEHEKRLQEIEEAARRERIQANKAELERDRRFQQSIVNQLRICRLNGEIIALDTNILMEFVARYSKVGEELSECRVLISDIILEELDGLKKADSADGHIKAKKAREASDYLQLLQDKKHVELQYYPSFTQEDELLLRSWGAPSRPDKFEKLYNDKRIIRHYSWLRQHEGLLLKVFSADKNFRIMAEKAGLSPFDVRLPQDEGDEAQGEMQGFTALK
ncbi:PIN domain-containing protein [Paenibacillus thalictri]|uniref:PIN domain-containing protein n=1 Tax=Paenibacillus thalictri TaxID=2527873 RepID=A0A4V2J485_9BACL|nr:PIN domain-containing protein [Paenibacillus thalictri]TBL78471.1 hypothetical protein EYB31_13255 [Paenibacillus thalictri]